MWGDKASLLPSSKLSFVHWEKKKLGKKLANEPDVAISRQLCFTVWHLGPTGSIQGGGEIRSGAFWQDTDGRFQTACREKGDWGQLLSFSTRGPRDSNLLCSTCWGCQEPDEQPGVLKRHAALMRAATQQVCECFTPHTNCRLIMARDNGKDSFLPG